MYLDIWFTDFIESPTNQLQFLRTTCTDSVGRDRPPSSTTVDDGDHDFHLRTRGSWKPPLSMVRRLYSASPSRSDRPLPMATRFGSAENGR